jgi:hypothetical protein
MVSSLFLILKTMQKAIYPNNLSNIQQELLNIYATNISDATLVELKQTMAKFFLDKIRSEADKIWKTKELSDANLSKID